MVSTRQATGNSAPRKLINPTPEPTTTKTTTATKKSTPAKPKANISKPRAKATTAGRVEKKKKAPATKGGSAIAYGDKLKDAVEKVAGAGEDKPAKKVCLPPHFRTIYAV
jgi:hypothetical protein